MQFEYTEPQTELERLIGGYQHLNAMGVIERGDAQRFGEVLERLNPPPFAMVYISSTGGDVEEAIALGRQIRHHSLWTGVGSYVLSPNESFPYIVPRRLIPGSCLSAATLMYLGGRFRFLDPGARFGVHQFRIMGEGVDQLFRSQQISALIARYLHELEIAPDFLERTASVHSSRLEDLEHGFLADIGITTAAISPIKWSVEARNNSVYVKGERDTIYGYQKLCLGYVVGGSFYLHAIFDPQGRHSEILKMSVAEISINGDSEIVDVSGEVFKQVENNWMNAVVPVDTAMATKLANASDFGLRFRNSLDAGMFWGIDAMPTETGRAQLQTILTLRSR